jgi:peptidoglycan/LPS O-acetylase OafA/YrhL
MASPRPQFRPDLEGLRGVAILFVVLFHAGVSRLSGGFVGVDVFFVLSGYFITGLLVREFGESGGVNLTEFYGRRALRLMPPLIVVLLVTLVVVTWLYAPVDRVTITGNARAVALYSGNIEFARGAVDYFSAGENPLLHTWSLAVEQQFYVLWPLLFLLVALLSARRIDDEPADDTIAATRRLLLWIAFAGVLSLAGSLWLTETSQPWAFFGMPTRIWEFALGGGLAVMMNGRTDKADGIATLLQLSGVAMIAWAVVSYDRATPYPGIAALLPALGTAALIVGGGRAPGSYVSWQLNWPPLRWLGRLSYAWYLWHWPLVGIGAVIDRDISVWGRLGWSVGALVLAWLTYSIIERSARDGRLSRIPTHWLAPAALAVSLVAALVAHGAMRVAERRIAAPDQLAFAAAREDRMTHDCWATTVEDAKGECAFGDINSPTTVVLLGDSHAEHWLGGLDRVARERGWKIIAMVKGGCPVADMPELMHARLKRYYHECTRYREAMLQRIVAIRPAAVILSSWDHYIPLNGSTSDWQVTPDMWRGGLRRTYSRLTSAGITTVVIRGTPRTWFNVPSCLSRRAAQVPFAQACEYERERSTLPVAIAAQNEAAKGLPIRFVDMNDQICASKWCSVVRNGVVVFTDDNHLTASFSRSVAPVLGARLDAALAR